MSHIGKLVLVAWLTLAGLAPALLAPQQPALAQEQTPPPTFAFTDLNYNELITSTVQLAACNSLRPSAGPIDLQTFNGPCPMAWTGSGTVIDPSGLILTNSHVALDDEQNEPVWVLVLRTVDARSLPQPAYF